MLKKTLLNKKKPGMTRFENPQLLQMASDAKVNNGFQAKIKSGNCQETKA